MPYRQPFTKRSPQHGAILFIMMVMILIVSMLGVSSMRSSVLNNRIASNHQHKNLAFQAAENAFALALRTEDPFAVIPSANAGASINHADFFSSSGAAGEPATSATLVAAYNSKINRDISGYEVDSITLLYVLTATGEVDGSPTRATNRMGVAFVQPRR